MDKSKLSLPFLVPLGRQPGGYLDFLGLSPGASETEAARAEANARLGFKKQFRKQRQALRESCDEKRISPEQCDSEVAKLVEEKQEKELKLNDLKDHYDRELAEARRQHKAGFSAPAGAWRNVCPMIGNGDHDWASLLARRPIGQIDRQVVDRMLDTCFGPNGREEVSQPVHAPQQGDTLTGDELVTALRDRDLLNLMVADALWGALPATVRAPWAKQITEWVAQHKDLEPRLQMQSKTPGSPGVDAYRLLGRPMPLTLGELDLSVDQDEPTPPAADDQQFVFDDLMAMLGKDAEEADDPMLQGLIDMLKGRRKSRADAGDHDAAAADKGSRPKNEKRRERQRGKRKREGEP